MFRRARITSKWTISASATGNESRFGPVRLAPRDERERADFANGRLRRFQRCELAAAAQNATADALGSVPIEAGFEGFRALVGGEATGSALPSSASARADRCGATS